MEMRCTMIERIGGVILLVAAAIACFGFVDRADSQMLWLNGQNFVAVMVLSASAYGTITDLWSPT
jgi:hypothetical protein